jgi:Zn finger protein HypA/HybF involved in hydrogenase expression
MAGIPAKCLDCGQILHYDGSKCMYFCPECESKKAEATTVKEMKKAA